MTTANTTQEAGGYGGPRQGGRPPLPLPRKALPRRSSVSSLLLLFVLLFALLLLLPATEAIKRASTSSTPAAGSKPSPPTSPPSTTTPTTIATKSKAIPKKVPTASARKTEETCEPERYIRSFDLLITLLQSSCLIRLPRLSFIHAHLHTLRPPLSTLPFSASLPTKAEA
jgi:hypothetical protein